MYQFTIEHIYCGFTTTIIGNDIYEALRKNGKDAKYWKVISVQNFYLA